MIFGLLEITNQQLTLRTISLTKVSNKFQIVKIFNLQLTVLSILGMLKILFLLVEKVILFRGLINHNQVRLQENIPMMVLGVLV